MVTKIPAPEYDREEVGYNLTVKQKADAALAANYLCHAFPWVWTAEGGEFWTLVERRLRAISEGEALK